ncbi:hypothetical protein Tco_0052474 [Tanacetum coccineum]
MSRSSARTIRKPVLRVLQKMITYGLCQRTTGYDKVQRKELWLISMFEAKHQNGHANVAWLITRIAKRAYLLTGEMLDGLSALVYCRPLDTTTLRELIGSNGRLIAEEPAPGDPEYVDTSTPTSVSIFELYDRSVYKIQHGEFERSIKVDSHIILNRYVVFSVDGWALQITINRSPSPRAILKEKPHEC